jgi:Leucine-rich repeat (LRR) protein
MEHTNLGTIPEKAIPVAEMVDLSFISCSLTAIPTIIKSMENLGNLYLNDNDLSGVQNVSAISPSVKFLSLARTKLQTIPKDLQQLELQSL